MNIQTATSGTYMAAKKAAGAIKSRTHTPPRRKSIRNEPFFTDHEQQVIRDHIETLVRKYGTQRTVADMLQITQPGLSAFLNGRYPAGPKLARSVAVNLGMTLVEMLGWDTDPSDRTPDPYPNRGRVLAALRPLGMSPAFIDTMRALELPAGARDLSCMKWLRLIVNRYEEWTVANPGAEHLF